MNCEYGCGKPSEFTLKNGKKCCSSSYNKCECVRKKNSAGLRKAWDDGKITSHQGPDNRTNYWTKGGYNNSGNKFKYSKEEVLAYNSKFTNEYICKFIVHEKIKEYKCDICKITSWNGKKIVLEIHHENGDNLDNSLSNLLFMCPNCHSQTPNFRGRNIPNRKKVSDETLLESLKEEPTIRKALLRVGLVAKGANYIRAKKLSAQIEKSDAERIKFGETLTGNTEPSYSKE